MNPDSYSELVRQINNLQKQVDGLIKPEVGRWIDWTPTVTQLGAVVVTVEYARYISIANTVIVQARLTVTGAGTANNAIVIGGIPAAVTPTNFGTNMDVIGTIIIRDATGPTFYQGGLAANGAAAWTGIAHNSTGVMGVIPNFGLANTDVIGFQAAYER